MVQTQATLKRQEYLRAYKLIMTGASFSLSVLFECLERLVWTGKLMYHCKMLLQTFEHTDNF